LLFTTSNYNYNTLNLIQYYIQIYFPTRRSSDLVHQRLGRRRDRLHRHGLRDRGARAHPDPVDPAQQLLDGDRAQGDAGRDRALRSEEHTSELQSREKIVCRLLLEKKNKNKNIK